MTVILPRDQGRQLASPYAIPTLGIFQVTSISQEGASTHIWCPSFCICHLRDRSPIAWLCQQCLYSGVTQECNKQTKGLNRLKNTPAKRSPWFRHWWADKNAHLPGRPNYIFSQLLLQGPAFNQAASMCWLKSFSLGHWWALAHPQLLKPLRTKKAVRTITEVWQTERSTGRPDRRSIYTR